MNELLSERDEAVRIAQSYKSELDKVVISDDDINHLHNTVSSILDIIKNYELSNSNNNNSDEESVENKFDAYEQIKELISVDTLKTMQLIGFNYKAAIGEPLTIMLKNYLLSMAPKTQNDNSIQLFLTPELVEVLKSKGVYENLKQLMGVQENSNGKK